MGNYRLKFLPIDWKLTFSNFSSSLVTWWPCKFAIFSLFIIYLILFWTRRKWWTDLWLNEGFATYVASLGVAHLHPEWKSFDEESVDNTLAIFKFDALRSSHPVSVEIGHPNQISQIFDAISYSKGSVIIRMMQMFLGEESFRRGVSAYLKKHEYANAKQDDLWSALTEIAHSLEALPKKFTVKEIMDTWTLQVGYPIVNVERNYDTHSAQLTQSRYLSTLEKTRDDLGFCWWIPLTYTDATKKNFNSSHVSFGCFSMTVTNFWGFSIVTPLLPLLNLLC